MIKYIYIKILKYILQLKLSFVVLYGRCSLRMCTNSLTSERKMLPRLCLSFQEAEKQRHISTGIDFTAGSAERKRQKCYQERKTLRKE